MLPKYICWKIWIARNKGIFENLNPSPGKVSSFAKALWAEALLSNELRHLHLEPLNYKEKNWTRDFITQHKTPWTDVKKPNHTRWQIRKNPESFNKWWTNLDRHTLFFDGASKGNLGLSSAGEVIFDPGGNKQNEFAWGIGRNTNNYAE